MRILALAGLAACGDTIGHLEPGPSLVVRSVVVSPQSLILVVGGKAVLTASIDADLGVTDRTVVWSSSDSTVATVVKDGTVTAVNFGTATIKATSAADPRVSGTAVIAVTGPRT